MADIEPFFEFNGAVGEYGALTPYTYRAYRCPSSTVWFMKGRYMVDWDGAPNCYHPQDYNVLPIASYPTVDVMAWQGALDYSKNGRDGATWTSVVTDANGQPIVQGDSDPFPNYLIATVPLVDDNYGVTDPRRYADARVVPYFALPGQILQQAGNRYNQIADGHTGNYGDYVTAMNISSSVYGHAIIGDTGNQPTFGEGSYALGQSIGRLDGASQPEVLYVIYPQTGVGQFTIPDVANLRQIGDALFDQWGGADLARGVLAAMP